MAKPDWHSCLVCHGLLKTKCVFCGSVRPKKKDMTEIEIIEFEAWEERINFLKYVYKNRIKFREMTTQDEGTDNEVLRLIGDFRKSIRNKILLEEEQERFHKMKFQYNGQTVHLHNRTYMNNRLAIDIVGPEGEPLARLTCNISDQSLETGEFFVKNYSENVEIAAAALASGLFEDTGKRVSQGWVEVPIWRFKND